MDDAMKKMLFIASPIKDEQTWATRVNYIFPDLLQAMCKKYNVSVFVPKNHPFMEPSLTLLSKKFPVTIVRTKKLATFGATEREQWKNMVAEVASKLQPDIITNALGSLQLGEAMGYAALQANSRAVVRVAGDEIGVRIIAGIYDDSPVDYAMQCDQEITGFLGAHGIIVLSPWEKDRIHNVLAADVQKMQVCIRGVDLAHFVPRSREQSLCDALRFLFIGRASAEKGYNLVEEAAKAIYKINPRIEFLFAGSFEPGQVENRRYLGWVDVSRLPELYREADALVLTSHAESIGQVVVEAMASGLPCILTKDLFSPIFSHGDDALLVDLHVSDIIENVLLLSENRELFAHLCRQSRKIATENFDREYWQSRYLDILDGTHVEGDTILDRKIPTRHLTVAELSEQNRCYPMKVLLISPQPFGGMETPGAYPLAEALNRYTNLLVVSNNQAGECPRVYSPGKGLRVIAVDFSSTGYMETILNIAAAFRPDIIHPTSWPDWPDHILYLKKYFTSAKYILDLQLPLSGAAQQSKMDAQHERRKQNNWDDIVNCHFIPAYEKLIQNSAKVRWKKRTLLLNELYNEPHAKTHGLEYERELHAKRVLDKILFHPDVN